MKPTEKSSILVGAGHTLRATRALLALSGVIGIGVGGALLFVPGAFQASSGITLSDNINVISETRASGGFILATGMLIVMGVFKSSMVISALVISSLLYLSYGASRILSMIVDGIPSDTLVAATGSEIAIGLLSLFMLHKTVQAQRRV